MKKILFCLGLFLAHTLAGPLKVEVTLMSGLELDSFSISADEMERYRSPGFANPDEAFRQDICERIPEVMRLSTYEKPVPHILCMRLLQDTELAKIPEIDTEKYHANLVIINESQFFCPEIGERPEIMSALKLMEPTEREILEGEGWEGILVGTEEGDYFKLIKIEGIGVVHFDSANPGERFLPSHIPHTLDKIFEEQLSVFKVCYTLKFGLQTYPEWDGFDELQFYKRPIFTRGFADFLAKAKRAILEITESYQIYDPDKDCNIFAAMCMLYTGEDVDGIEERRGKKREISPEEIEEASQILRGLNLIPYK